jgi:hypothetical protein
VYAALAYYEDHRDEIDRAAADEACLAEDFRKRNPHLSRDYRN